MNTKERPEVMEQVNAANDKHTEEWEKKQIKGVFIDVENATASARTIEKSLDGYYKLLGCDTIDIVERLIDGRLFSIVCDDDALLKPSLLGAIDKDGHPMLYGNLFVVKFDGVDDVMSLNDNEIDYILQHIVPVLFRCEHSMRRGIALGKCDYD